MSWPIVKLGDVVVIKGGGTPDKSIPEYWDGDIPWASVKDFKAYELTTTIDSITEEGVAASATQIIPAGNIIVPTRMAVGKAAINMIDLAINQDLKAIFVGPKIDRKFLLHALLANADRLIRQATGATVKGIKVEVLKNLEIPLPPLEEQRRIAGILDQADALRRLRARALEKLNTLGQAVFQEMFGGALETETLLHNWTEETLDQSIQYIDYRGKTPPKSEAGVRLVTAKNVRMGYVSPTPEEFIPAEQYEEWMSRGYPRNGDVVFTTEAPLGNVAILNEPAKFAVGQRIVTMRPVSSRLTSEYLMYFLRSQRFVKDMLANASGSTVRGIKTSLLKKIKIRYPSIHEQLHFSQCLQISQSTLEQCEIAAQDSGNLFASLQSAAFQGKL